MKRKTKYSIRQVNKKTNTIISPAIEIKEAPKPKKKRSRKPSQKNAAKAVEELVVKKNSKNK